MYISYVYINTHTYSIYVENVYAYIYIHIISILFIEIYLIYKRNIFFLNVYMHGCVFIIIIIKAFRSAMTTSLKRSLGRPRGRCPTANSPWKMDFGICSSSIRRTWPIHLRRLLRIAVYLSLLLVSFSTVVFGTRSCHDRPRICRRQRK